METTDLATLVRLSALINSSLDIDVVLDTAMRCVEELMDAEASSIFELDRDKGEIFFRLARGERGEKVKELRLKVGEGVAGWVAETGSPALLSDPGSDPRFAQHVDAHSGFRTRSILCIPLICKGRLVGVLQVLNKRALGGFDSRDLELLTVLGNQVAIALENAQLYARLSQQFALTTEELRVTQRKLIRSERLAALGRLSQGVAHEVRNPVMIISGFTRRLQGKYPPDDPIQETLKIILTEAQRLEEIVREVEDLANLREATPKPTSLVSVVEKALSRALSSSPPQGIRIERSFMKGAPNIMADGELLELALGNIMTNGLEAMPEGGILYVGVSTQTEHLLITVRDTGVGISPEALPNVFDPFFTSKMHGSGLGLTTANRIVSDHNGEIHIRSDLGQGTEVQIQLPTWQPI